MNCISVSFFFSFCFENHKSSHHPYFHHLSKVFGGAYVSYRSVFQSMIQRQCFIFEWAKNTLQNLKFRKNHKSISSKTVTLTTRILRLEGWGFSKIKSGFKIAQASQPAWVNMRCLVFFWVSSPPVLLSFITSLKLLLWFETRSHLVALAASESWIAFLP